MDINDIRTVRAIAAQVAATSLSRPAGPGETYASPPRSDEVIAFARSIEAYISGR